MDFRVYSGSSAPCPLDFLEISHEEEVSESLTGLQESTQTAMETGTCDYINSYSNSQSEFITVQEGNSMCENSQMGQSSSKMMNALNMEICEKDKDGVLHCLRGNETGPCSASPLSSTTHELSGRDHLNETEALRKTATSKVPLRKTRKRRIDEEWKLGDKISEVYENDEDVPSKLREMLQTCKSSRNVSRARRLRRQPNVKVQGKRMNKSFATKNSIISELFDGDNSALEFEWSPMKTFVQKQETFNPINRPGPRQPTPSAYEAFRQFWDDEILNHIVTETNRYGSQLKTTLVIFHRWYDTNIHEIFILFAFWMMLGIIKMPTISSCFSANYILETNVFKKLMSQSRYWLLSKALCFVDNSTCTRNSSKLFHLGPIVDHLNKKFSQNYTPTQNISIDESLTLWKGKLAFKQYISNKAVRFGIKTFELCEASTGYMWSFMVYTGKSSPHCFSSSLPKTLEVVVQLIKPLLNQGYRVFMDNWFNSVILARYLKRNRTDCVGTLRKNSLNVPPIIKLVNLSPGQCVARHCGDIAVMAYHNKRTVYTISTHHGTETDIVIDISNRTVYRPVVIDAYNKFMLGVDKKDQMLEPYLLERKHCLGWYKKLFKRLLNVSILNSFIIVNSSVTNQSLQSDFRLKLVDEIIKRHLKHVPRKKRFFIGKSDLPASRLCDQHFIKRSNKTGGRHQCVWCTVREKRYRKTVYICEECGVPLCLDGCFKKYHTVQ